MDIIRDSAVIEVNIEDARPGTSIDMDNHRAWLHMTKNADAVMSGADEVAASGINLWGKVDVRLGRGENTSNWKFRFIQLAVNLGEYFAYAGKTSAAGYMQVYLDTPPAVPREYQYAFLLDSDPTIHGPGVMPFTNTRDHAVQPKWSRSRGEVPGVSTVLTSMDDAPSLRMSLAFKNMATHETNYLRMASVQKLFLTAFVVRDERTMKIEPLAFVPWSLSWAMSYRWQHNQCLTESVGGVFKVGDSTRSIAPAAKWLGADENHLAQKIINPTTNPDETANAVSRKARRSLDQRDNTFNLQYFDHWIAINLSNFWQP